MSSQQQPNLVILQDGQQIPCHDAEFHGDAPFEGHYFHNDHDYVTAQTEHSFHDGEACLRLGTGYHAVQLSDCSESVQHAEGTRVVRIVGDIDEAASLLATA